MLGNIGKESFAQYGTVNCGYLNKMHQFFVFFLKGVKFRFVLGLEIVKSQTVTTVSAVMMLAEED